MKKFNKQNLIKALKGNAGTYLLVIAAYIILQLMSAGDMISSSLKGQLVPICAYVVMAVSLNLTVGVLGELSLGHASFMSVGAFTGVITAMSLSGVIPMGGVRLLLAMIVGAIFAAIFGVIVGVPVLRLRGDYLAIVTLAFGEIIKNIINCLYVGIDANGLHLSVTDAESLNMDGGTVILNGPMGAVGINKLSGFTAGFLLVIVCLIVVLNFVNSRSGRAVMAIRDNVIAAESVGINVTRYRLMAFVTSAALAGAAGALYAMNYSTVSAAKFNFNTSILVLVFVVLGGLGNIRGSIIAAAALTILPELLREFSDYRMLVYAIVLIVVMLMANSTGGKRIQLWLGEKFRALFGKFAKRNTAKGE